MFGFEIKKTKDGLKVIDTIEHIDVTLDVFNKPTIEDTPENFKYIINWINVNR